MKVAAISEFKSKLAKFLRMVKTGEEVEIRERGVPIAKLSSIKSTPNAITIPPRKDPARLSKIQFSVKTANDFEVVEFLMEDRNKR